MPIALFALALAAFSIGTTEFVINGLLPVLSADLAVSIPTAGLLVTGYATGVAIGGPIIAMLVARLPRKTVIVALTAVFTLGQVLCALAPDYGLLLVARLVSAAAHGVFFGVGSVAVAHLVPPERRGAALSLFIGGIMTLAFLELCRSYQVFELGLGLMASLSPVGMFDLAKWWFRRTRVVG